jgi:dTDP-4-amino-4,6-dideoxygalactose transaminase
MFLLVRDLSLLKMLTLTKKLLAILQERFELMQNKSLKSSWPIFSQAEVDAVTSVLQSGRVNYWTGEHGVCFEREFAEFIGVSYAVATMNGTVALEAALRSIDIGEDDEVIVPARTFVATASAVVADVDALSQNLTVETIKRVVTAKTKAIIAVHLAGWPCYMDAIMTFAKKHQLFVVEDCAQATGPSTKVIWLGLLVMWQHFLFVRIKS